MAEEKEFKKQVIYFVKAGKYARALGLLKNKIKGIFMFEAIKEDLGGK